MRCHDRLGQKKSDERIRYGTQSLRNVLGGGAEQGVGRLLGVCKDPFLCESNVRLCAMLRE